MTSPQELHKRMNEAKMASEKLVMKAQSNRAQWSDAQREELSLLWQIMKHHHWVLHELIEGSS